MALKVMYTLFLGLLVVLFIGFGIAAFYPAPEVPSYPVELRSKEIRPVEPATPETEEERQLRLEYEEQSEEYREVIRPRYERNVSIIAMVAAVVVLVISLTALTAIRLLSDGLLLGGVLTLLYAIIRGLMGNDHKYSFVVVSVGLVVALVLGYIKFIAPENNKK